MGIISGYPDDTSTTDNDKFLTVDSGGTTKNTPASSVKTYIQSNALFTPANLVAGTGSTWVWTSRTPTLTNVTVGNGTFSVRYKQIGKTVHEQGSFTLGTTSSVTGVVAISLPVTAAGFLTASESVLGTGTAVDAAVFVYPLDAMYASTTTFNLNARITVAGTNPVYQDINTNRRISNTVPFAFSTGDKFSWNITYEAA